MSRPLRPEFPDAVWHVTCRGNERREVFRDDGDRERFLSILGRTVSLFRWRLHAFVLMGNHYHLLVETPEPTLSRGMRQLNGVYTQSFNRAHERVGHLFQGRFKAILVEKEAHLLELCRYVVLNPVRARMVPAAKAWPWSSYRATAGLMEAPDWLETGWTLEQLGTSRRSAVAAYRRFVAEGTLEDYRPWENLRGQIYLGSEKFRKESLRRGRASAGSRDVPRAQRRAAPVPKEALLRRCLEALGCGAESLKTRTRLLSDERKGVALILRREGLLNLMEIGELLGVREGQASRLVADGAEVLARNSDLRRRLEDACGSGTK